MLPTTMYYCSFMLKKIPPDFQSGGGEEDVWDITKNRWISCFSFVYEKV